MILQLLGNGIRFRLLKVIGAPMKPWAMSLEVTRRCIARCMMCNIWKVPQSAQELSLEEWLGVLSSDLSNHLVELDITGGEPFLREDLLDLVAGAGHLTKTHLRRLSSIAITTNGLLTDRVARWTREMLEKLEETGQTLVLVVAMDAVGEVHDRIRGVPGAWEKANRTVDQLLRLQARHPHLVLGLKTTILPVNVDELEAVSRYAASKGLFSIVSPCIITEGRYRNREKETALAFRSDQIQKILSFYQKEPHGWGPHARTLLHYYRTGTVRKPCSCGFNYLFVRSDGQVFPCPLINRSLGNVKESPAGKLYRSEEAGRFRRRVGKHPECKVCTEPGLERYALALEGFSYLGMRLRMGKARFSDMHHHLGMDKYVGN